MGHISKEIGIGNVADIVNGDGGSTISNIVDILSIGEGTWTLADVMVEIRRQTAELGNMTVEEWVAWEEGITLAEATDLLADTTGTKLVAYNKQ